MKKRKTKKKEVKCKHQWHQTELFGFKTKYIYRLCGKCGHTQRAKLTFRDYNAQNL